MKTIREIGSEFWTNGPTSRNRVFLLSGRTALEYIIRDILKRYEINSALLPSYCCHTMIEPFFRHRIPVRFYDIYFDEVKGSITADVPKARENEVFYFMNYFGFHELRGLDLNEVLDNYAVSIEDRTHSCMGGNSESNADYSYASYRKWTGFDGIAVAVKKNGGFVEYPKTENSGYTSLRRQAFSMKRDFIHSGFGDKEAFLSLFEEAEHLLELDYAGYKPSADTMAAFLQLDTSCIAEKRKENAVVLLEGLKDIPEMERMFSAVKENDVPLFVPALVKTGRTELRKYLIGNTIYCPIHWQVSEFHYGISKRAETLYREELSLVCDQRYDVEDMERMIDCIRKFYVR
ncbi:MAG: hypothetical protein HFI76_06845 [Lachnospiraceae bacterium]|nr:hypothetical protein [Lachnospiraceae bacterium]